MSGPGNLVVQTAGASGARAMLGELVQAWARDVATGTPIHILELGPERRGAWSGCECPSCGLALTAVNAAKKYICQLRCNSLALRACTSEVPDPCKRESDAPTTV